MILKDNSVLQQFFRDFVPSSKNTCSEEFTRTCRGRAFFIVGWRSRIPYRKPRTHRLRTLHYPHVDPHENPVLNADIIILKKNRSPDATYWRRSIFQTPNVVHDDPRVRRRMYHRHGDRFYNPQASKRVNFHAQSSCVYFVDERFQSLVQHVWRFDPSA
jgi:hypothetical protein